MPRPDHDPGRELVHSLADLEAGEAELSRLDRELGLARGDPDRAPGRPGCEEAAKLRPSRARREVEPLRGRAVLVAREGEEQRPRRERAGVVVAALELVPRVATHPVVTVADRAHDGE